MAAAYNIPSEQCRSALEIAKSRFITTIGYSGTVDAARAFITQIRAEMPDASHHVYAFRVGYGSSVIEGMSDDGEPSGTAGPPTLAVLRGADIGDVVLVTTRYFGGTKLGTGGLVRAYTESAQLALSALPIERKVEKHLVGMSIPYSLYQLTRRLIEQCQGSIEDETFGADITLMVRFPADRLDEFANQLRDISAGQVEVVSMDE